MPAFDYIGVDARGKRHKGTLDGDSSRHVRQLLRDKGWVPLEITPARDDHRGSGEGFSALFKPRLGAQELALFTRQLATLVQAGLTLDDALRSVAQQAESPASRRLLTAVRAKVIEGYGLAHSLAEFPQAFPQLYRATVAAGEKAGHLDLVLNRLADYTESRHDTQRKVQGALIYPAILVVLSLLIVTGMLTYVVPDIVKVFDNQGQALPALTRGLMALSDFIRAHGGKLLLTLLLGLWLFLRALRDPARRRRWHAFLLRVPVLGKLIRDAQSARLVSTLGILTRSGVPLVEALRIAAEVVDNLPMQDAVMLATERGRK